VGSDAAGESSENEGKSRSEKEKSPSGSSSRSASGSRKNVSDCARRWCPRGGGKRGSMAGQLRRRCGGAACSCRGRGLLFARLDGARAEQIDGLGWYASACRGVVQGMGRRADAASRSRVASVHRAQTNSTNREMEWKV
jgi:hypothetical protein